MHRFLHGIRRSSCWPVASPLAFARLTCPLPLPILNEPSGYGDLLQSGEEDQQGDLLPSGDEDEDGDLLPQSAEDGKGPLPPSQGDEQDDGEGLLQPSHGDDIYGFLPAYQSGELEDFRFSTKVHEGKPCVEEGILLSAAHAKPMLSSTDIRMLLSSTLYVFDPGGVPSLHEQDVLLDLLLMGDFDPGGLSEVPSACQPSSMTSHWRSTFAADRQHLLDVGAAPTLMVNKYADTSVHVHIHIGHTEVLQEVVGRNPPGFCLDDESHLAGLSYGEAHCRFSEVHCKVLLFMELLHDDADPYGCSLWLNGQHSRESVETHFLIPLRGSNSVQWNDEDFDDDVAALKMTTKRRMAVMQLLYLMKDLLDPG